MRSFNSVLREAEALNRRLANRRGFHGHALIVLAHAKALKRHATEAAIGLHQGPHRDLLLQVRKKATGIEEAARSTLRL